MSANSRDLDQAAAEPGATLLLNAREAARLAGISEPSWWRHHAAGLVPDAVKIGRSTRWRRADIARWIELGCPSRGEFELRQAMSRKP